MRSPWPEVPCDQGHERRLRLAVLGLEVPGLKCHAIRGKPAWQKSRHPFAEVIRRLPSRVRLQRIGIRSSRDAVRALVASERSSCDGAMAGARARPLVVTAELLRRLPAALR